MNGMLQKLLMVAAALALPASQAGASEAMWDDITKRSDCAQLELAEAMGDKVPADQVAACKSRPHKPPPPRHKVKPKDDYIEMPPPPPPPEPPPHPSKPDWLMGKKSTSAIIYGVGLAEKGGDEAALRAKAFSRAIGQIAAQLQVQIDSVMNDAQSFASAEATGPDGRHASASAEAQAFSSTTQLLVRNSIDEVKLEDFYTDGKGTYYLLASLNVEELAKKQDAIANSVLESMADAVDGVLAAFANNQLTQEAIFNLADAIEQADVVGRTPIGRKVKDRWKEAKDKLNRLGKHLLSCVEVDGGANDAGNQVALTITCMGRPIRVGRFAPKIEGGIVDVPQTLLTDAEGALKFKIGTVFGKAEVKVTLVPDLGNSRASAIFGDPQPGQKATFELKASEVPTGTMRIVGLQEGSPEYQMLGEAVSGFAERKLSIEIADAGALKIIATITWSTKAKVGAQTSQAAEMDVTVTGPRGRLFAKHERSAGLATSDYEAKKMCIQRLIDTMRRW